MLNAPNRLSNLEPSNLERRTLNPELLSQQLSLHFRQVEIQFFAHDSIGMDFQDHSQAELAAAAGRRNRHGFTQHHMTRCGQIARHTNTVVVPANVSDVAGIIAAAMRVFASTKPA